MYEADWQADFILNLIKSFSDEKIKHTWNSIVIDICAIQHVLWKKLNSISRFQHTFFVPCDSHGLQFLIKNILELSAFFIIFRKVSAIVTYFKFSKKQFTYLREYPIKQFKKLKTFILIRIIRWGT
jgi:hypothetical protein